MNAQRRVFAESFKREAVDRVANSGLAPGEVARGLPADRALQKVKTESLELRHLR